MSEAELKAIGARLTHVLAWAEALPASPEATEVTLACLDGRHLLAEIDRAAQAIHPWALEDLGELVSKYNGLVREVNAMRDAAARAEALVAAVKAHERHVKLRAAEDYHEWSQQCGYHGVTPTPAAWLACEAEA